MYSLRENDVALTANDVRFLVKKPGSRAWKFAIFSNDESFFVSISNCFLKLQNFEFHRYIPCICSNSFNGFFSAFSFFRRYDF